MKVTIFCEGGGGRGYGHITRCVSVYQAFEEVGVLPILVIDGDLELENVLKNTRFSTAGWLRGDAEFQRHLNGCDIAVFDSYHAAEELYRMASERATLCIYFDDNMRMDYPRGIVVNSLLGAENHFGADGSQKKYLLGPTYQPLRREFWNASPKKIGAKLGTILITLGGEDIRRLSQPVTASISEFFPEVKKLIVIGAGTQNMTPPSSLDGDACHTIHAPAPEELRTVMQSCDMSVSAGGQTLFELLRLGIPTVAIVVAENQKRNVQALVEAGAILSAGEWDEPGLFKKLKDHLNAMEDPRLRETLAETGPKLINGRGSRLIVEKIMSGYREASG